MRPPSLQLLPSPGTEVRDKPPLVCRRRRHGRAADPLGELVEGVGKLLEPVARIVGDVQAQLKKLLEPKVCLLAAHPGHNSDHPGGRAH